MNKIKKFGIGLFGFVLLLLIGYSCVSTVFAENVCIDTPDNPCVVPDGETIVSEISSKCKTLTNANALSSRYNPQIEVKQNGEGWKYFEIKLSPVVSDDPQGIGLKNVQFNLVKYTINNVTYDVANPASIVLKADGSALKLDYNTYGKNVDFAFKMSPNHKDPNCTDEDMQYAELILHVYVDEEETQIDPTPVFSPIEQEQLNFTSHIVDCNNATTEFDTKFCFAKQAAISQGFVDGNDVDFTGSFNNGAKHSGTATFTCDSTRVYPKEDLLDENYYTLENKKYMYGSGSYYKNFGSYTYHFYNSSSVKEIGSVTCKVNCEEAVTVEYGTPVASKAGLCFEYKVRVTSRVSCDMVESPTLPQTFGTCTPAPRCTGTNSSGNSYVVTEGGPSSDFDACIAACDGGKYTSKCSKQCYNDIYQPLVVKYSNKKTSVDEPSDCDTLSNIKTINDAIYCNNAKYSGYYTYNGSSINWNSTNSNLSGRWYSTSGYNGGYLNSYGCKPEYVVYSNHNGICRHKYSNGGICNDSCKWKTDCIGQNKYLNPYFNQADYTANMAKYNNAVRECKLAASCSTTTAEFTISVDYKDGAGTIKTIDFPYSQSGGLKDKANFQGTQSTSDDDYSTLLKENGCYKRGQVDNEQLYNVEWGFPGSWVNKKTGELSYLLKPEQPINGWQKIDKKFCIPFDAQDVNVKWWNYYYTKLGTNIACPQNTPEVETYNIRAEATNFGYFEWNVGVKCFYAVNNTEKQPCDPPDPGEPEDIKYVIRSIDLENVFPDTDGEHLSDASDIGRTPGFNWSNEAANSKNIKYQSSPLDYAKRIQEKGYTIYSNEEQMDYKFRLTPAVLKELRTARSTDYTQFYGKNYVDDNGVIRYYSDLLDDLETKDNIVFVRPSGSGQICNNTKHSGSTWSCESHT